jgi:hypothetical protein
MKPEEIRKQFKDETKLNVEITERCFAHSVTCVNPKYVHWLESRVNILKPNELQGVSNNEDKNKVCPIRNHEYCNHCNTDTCRYHANFRG